MVIKLYGSNTSTPLSVLCTDKKMAGYCLDCRTVRKASKSLWRDIRYIPSYAWVVIFLHIFEGFIGFAVDLNMMTFFHQKFSMNSQTSGQFFGLQGIFVLVLGIPGGIMLDKLGIKVSLIIGFLAATVSRVILAFSNNETVSIATLSVGVSLGGGLIALGLYLTLERMPEGNSKNLAFNLLYCSENLGDVLASWVNPLMIDIGGFNQFQFMFLCTAAVSFVGLVLVLLLYWEPDPLLDPNAVEGEATNAKDLSYWNIVTQKTFLRALTLALVFLGVRTMFKHLSSIVPIYMQNLYGPSVNYSFAIGINPLGVIILSPIFGVMLRNLKNPLPVIFLGTLLSALSPLAMVIWRPAGKEWPVWLFNSIFTVGEALYSPKVSQLAVSIPPPSQKGIYSTLITFPAVIGTFFSGFQAGYLLEHFCPDPVTVTYDYWAFYSCANLWIFVMVVALISPMALVCSGRFMLGIEKPKYSRKRLIELEKQEY